MLSWDARLDNGSYCKVEARSLSNALVVVTQLLEELVDDLSRVGQNEKAEGGSVGCGAV